MTRLEFMEMLADNLTDEECRQLFELGRDEMKDGSATWNMSIEIQYEMYMMEDEEEGE